MSIKTVRYVVGCVVAFALIYACAVWFICQLMR
jgi:hypothetical protein